VTGQATGVNASTILSNTNMTLEVDPLRDTAVSIGSSSVRDRIKQKEIVDEMHTKENVLYIHCNPVQHKFTNTIEEWKFSSYRAHLSDKPTMIRREEVMSLFDTKEDFIYCHHEKLERIKSVPFEEEFI
jgi:hypothetical protein